MSYSTLKKLFYMDASNERFESNTSLATTRREAESTFRTGFAINGEELFLATPRELSLLNETILGREREIAVALSGLPPIARGALIRSLVITEVVCSNELEGVYSTRRQINDLLATTRTPSPRALKTLEASTIASCLARSSERTLPTAPSLERGE